MLVPILREDFWLNTSARTAVALSALVGLAIPWLAWVGAHRVDDVFILYRYAENVASGGGFAFNAGTPVEGVTTFLWTLALVPFVWFGAVLPTVGPWLSAACGIAILLLLPRLSARVGGRVAPDLGDCFPSLLLLVTPGFAYWSRGGLETVPFGLLLLLAMLSHGAERANDPRRFGPSWLWFGLAIWTRPETPLYVAAAAVDRLWSAPRESFSKVAKWVARTAAVFASLIAFRLLYFGDIVPNTYYAKAGSQLASRLRDGIFYSLSAFADLLPHPHAARSLAVVVGTAAAASIVLWGLRRDTARPLALLLALMFVAIAFNGGDWMPLNRFWVPGIPFLFVLASALAREKLATRANGSLALMALAGIFLVNGAASTALARLESTSPLHPDRSARRAYADVSNFLIEHSQPGDTLALMDVGRIGYATKLPIVDISGLVTPWIAKSPGGFLNKQYPIERLLEPEPPRFFVLRPLRYPIDRRIADDPRFRAEYRPVYRRKMDLTQPGWESAEMFVFEHTSARVTQ
ncbi:MAG: hypothetical protein VX246_16540 [Myxococcota bacterium]|nr:hypothetical protein [Myxococcota bacterium]